jgi:hypothetical protein
MDPRAQSSESGERLTRLQGHAAGGEVIVSNRLAGFLDRPPDEPEQSALEGEQAPVLAYRVRRFAERA